LFIVPIAFPFTRPVDLFLLPPAGGLTKLNGQGQQPMDCRWTMAVGAGNFIITTPPLLHSKAKQIAFLD